LPYLAPYFRFFIRYIAKFGSGALAPPFDEAKAIISDSFVKTLF